MVPATLPLLLADDPAPPLAAGTAYRPQARVDRGLAYRADLGGPRRTFPGDAGDVADASGRIRSGVRVGGAAWADGPDGGHALRFDGYAGADDRVEVPGWPDLAGAATLMVRLRLD